MQALKITRTSVVCVYQNSLQCLLGSRRVFYLLHDLANLKTLKCSRRAYCKHAGVPCTLCKRNVYGFHRRNVFPCDKGNPNGANSRSGVSTCLCMRVCGCAEVHVCGYPVRVHTPENIIRQCRRWCILFSFDPHPRLLFTP